MGNRPSICGLCGANSKNKPEEEIDLDMKVKSKTDKIIYTLSYFLNNSFSILFVYITKNIKIPRLKGNAASTINRNNQDLSIHNNKASQINSSSTNVSNLKLKIITPSESANQNNDENPSCKESSLISPKVKPKLKPIITSSEENYLLNTNEFCSQGTNLSCRNLQTPYKSIDIKTTYSRGMDSNRNFRTAEHKKKLSTKTTKIVLNGYNGAKESHSNVFGYTPYDSGEIHNDFSSLLNNLSKSSTANHRSADKGMMIKKMVKKREVKGYCRPAIYKETGNCSNSSAI